MSFDKIHYVIINLEWFQLLNELWLFELVEAAETKQCVILKVQVEVSDGCHFIFNPQMFSCVISIHKNS